MMTYRQFLLVKLAEECNEVAQRALKQAQFGRDERQENSPSEHAAPELGTNSDRLLREFIDLTTVTAILQEVGELPIPSEELVHALAEAKRAKIQKYLLYSNELGMIET